MQNFLFKATCLEGQTRPAADDTSTGYQNGIACKCAAYTDYETNGECVNGQQQYTRTCDKDTVVFVDQTKNECSGSNSMMADCGEFVFGDWEEWLYCSENCGVGVTTRTRTCTPVGNSTCPTDGPLVIESKPCQIQKCLTCENYENYCDSLVNTECKDITLENGETTVCSKCLFLTNSIFRYFLSKMRSSRNN